MATKTFEVKVPRSAIDLRIKHEKVLTNLKDNNGDELSQKCNFVADISGARLSDIKLLSKRDLELIWSNAMMAFLGFKINPIPQNVITLDGKEYELINPDKAPTGWHIDFSSLSKQEKIDSVMLVCLFYFPKGEVYGAEDIHGNLLNPIKERYEVFKEHMPLQTFLEAKAFFLTKLHASIKYSILEKKVTERTQKVVKTLRLHKVLNGRGRKLWMS